jgi:hypothetical protein
MSLTAASQILLSPTMNASDFVWELNSQNTASYPNGDTDFVIDPEARKSLHHAVDATWISFTFALTFTVLAYIRKTIDGEESTSVCDQPRLIQLQMTFK